MVGNFYVGIVCHKNSYFKNGYNEKLILYTDNDVEYLDLLTGKSYTSDNKNKDFVDVNTLIPVDVSQFKEDYIYLLNRYKENISISRKKIFDK